MNYLRSNVMSFIFRFVNCQCQTNCQTKYNFVGYEIVGKINKLVAPHHKIIIFDRKLDPVY